MGFAVPGEAASSVENSGQDETEETGNEDESIVHQCASVGDVEVEYNLHLCFFDCCIDCWFNLLNFIFLAVMHDFLILQLMSKLFLFTLFHYIYGILSSS